MMTRPAPEKALLFVGLSTVDLQFLVTDFPRPNTKTKARENRIFTGGPAANAAVAAAHLGAEVDLFTPIGEHPLAGFIIDDLRRHRVRIIDPIDGLEGRPTFASIITSHRNGERTIFSYHPEHPVPAHCRAPMDVTKYGLALFDGFHPEAAVPIATACRARGVITVLDGGSWKPGVDQLLPHIDIAICSNDFSVPEGDAPENVFAHLHRRGVSHGAITRGHETILYSAEGKTGEVPVDPVDTVDTLGAGDIFHGAFAYFHAQGVEFDAALKAASTVAGHSCRSLGTRAWMRPTG